MVGIIALRDQLRGYDNLPFRGGGLRKQPSFCPGRFQWLLPMGLVTLELGVSYRGWSPSVPFVFWGLALGEEAPHGAPLAPDVLTRSIGFL